MSLVLSLAVVFGVSVCVASDPTVSPKAGDPVPGPRGTTQAPHLEISVFMRGLLKRLVTRIYFADDPRNGADPVLALVAPERRGTLIAKAAPGQPDRLAWDVVLQGAGETVFFDC